jgi:rubrerythrin
VDYWVCQVCGMTVEGEAPDECPVCKAKKQAFKKVD